MLIAPKVSPQEMVLLPPPVRSRINPTAIGERSKIIILSFIFHIAFIIFLKKGVLSRIALSGHIS